MKFDKYSPDRDRLNSSTRNGAIMSIVSFSNRVGRGSLAHCLSESAPTAATTTSAVTNLKSVKLHPERTGTKIGGGASLVSAYDAHPRRCTSNSMRRADPAKGSARKCDRSKVARCLGCELGLKELKRATSQRRSWPPWPGCIIYSHAESTGDVTQRSGQ